jgi:hypothetical protein
MATEIYHEVDGEIIAAESIGRSEYPSVQESSEDIIKHDVSAILGWVRFLGILTILELMVVAWAVLSVM